MDKEHEATKMHPLAFRERQGLANKTSHTLSERIVKPLDMRSLSALLAHRVMLRFGNHVLVGLPKVAVARRFLVPPRYTRPQRSTRLLTAVSDRDPYNLSSDSAQG